MIESLLKDESLRRSTFPVTAEHVFLSHAAVAPLPRAAAAAIREEAAHGSSHQQEASRRGLDFMQRIEEVRSSAASLINALPSEIALLGPTALGLSLVANGLDWQVGDEVVFYQDDYPANVYPWLALESRGVRCVRLQPAQPGEITPDLVFAALTSKTKLVALASCHFLTGFRIDLETIGHELKRRHILFSLDAIQSLGATPVSASHVDFMSADSHKWMLGPLGAGIFYVKESNFSRLKPTLLGSWNITSPRFIAQPTIAFEKTARRYEPGSLNMIGIFGMKAGIDLLLEARIDKITTRLLHLRRHMVEGLQQKGYYVIGAQWPQKNQSGIITCHKEGADLPAVFQRLQDAGIVATLRWNREGEPHLRFSPHFYNLESELDAALATI